MRVSAFTSLRFPVARLPLARLPDRSGSSAGLERQRYRTGAAALPDKGGKAADAQEQTDRPSAADQQMLILTNKSLRTMLGTPQNESYHRLRE